MTAVAEIGTVYTTPRLCLPCGTSFVPPRRPDGRILDYCSDACRRTAGRRQGEATFSAARQSALFDRFAERGREVARSQPARIVHSRPSRTLLPKPPTPARPRSVQAPKARPNLPMWAQSLIRARVGRGWDRFTLARRLGISINTVANWESGCTEPSVSQFAALAAALGLSLDALWRGTV